MHNKCYTFLTLSTCCEQFKYSGKLYKINSTQHWKRYIFEFKLTGKKKSLKQIEPSFDECGKFKLAVLDRALAKRMLDELIRRAGGG